MMSDDPQNDLKPEMRQLGGAMSFFLKRAMTSYSVETCARAFILTLAKFVPSIHLIGYLWQPARPANQRIRFRFKDGQVEQELEPGPPTEVVQREASTESEDGLTLVLHPSLKSLQNDPAERKALEARGCRAAVEIQFAYYSKPILRVVLGLSNAKSLPNLEAQDFLLVFCRCCLVSLNGAYLAELDEREGRREKPELKERFHLTLQWFHSLVRHLNIGIAEIQNGQPTEAEDALQRALIVAGICLAEMLALMGKTQPETTRGPASNSKSPIP
ncbi:MAG: hypothetical protein JOZ60_03830 [Verrucomicrobia bacterium]|nr:hypothetical protein [Verrucomicrobiota bacterium]